MSTPERTLAAMILEAERSLEARNLDAAAELFQRARALAGEACPTASLGLARVALLLDRADDAVRLLDEVLARDPRHAEALRLRGVTAEARGDLDEALAWLARALASDATSWVASFNQGRVFAQLRRWDLAAASFSLALQHGATAAEVRVQLGVALFRAGRVTDALRTLATAVERHRDHLDATLTLADCLVETGRIDLADRLLTEAGERFPEAGAIPSKRAVIAMHRNDLEGARNEAWRHTRLCPRDEEAWLFAAVLDTMALRFDSAERALRQALRVNPTQWRAHYHLGGLYDALKDVRRARDAYRVAVELNPGAWEPLNNLATGLLEEGSPDALAEARGLLERAAGLHRGPRGVTARYNLVLACWRLGDAAGAHAVARELLHLAPAEHPLAQETRRLLREVA